MKTKMINSQLSNFKTYLMYFRRMLTLAENVFEFKNLPEIIDVAYLNKILLRNGSIAFFYDEDLESVVALPYSTMGKLDIYGRPNKIWVKGDNGYSRTIEKGNFVIMYDNNGRYPLYLDITQMAERIALCIRTQDINIYHQRTPRVWKTSKDKELSLKRMLDQIDSNVETIFTYESLDIDDMGVVVSPAPYVTDKIDLHLDKLWADFYELIGVANIQEQKKERVIQDEMTASQGGTIASRYSRFQPRQQAIDLINEKFGTSIQVQYYDGIPSSIEDIEDVSEEISDESEVEDV
ncbi:MAG: hypothetical protein IIZ99_03600 [Turicibacter sp.]|nr:hypothetical protein [Turicibacter sp.]